MSETNGGISQEEFLRLQEQLIELRNINYELKEKLRKQIPVESNDGSAKKDALQFATRLLNRSKDKDIEQRLESEIEFLKNKLMVQEEEFRLQQQTFIAELNQVVRNSENLEKELTSVKHGDNDVSDKETSNPSSLELEVEGLNRKLTSKEETIAEKEACIRALEDSIIELRLQTEQNQKDASDAREALSKLSYEHSELKNICEEKNVAISSLEVELEGSVNASELQAHCSALEQTCQERDELIENLRSAITNLQESCSHWEEKLSYAEKVKKNLQDSLQSVEDDSRKTVEALRKQNYLLEKRASDVENNLRAMGEKSKSEIEAASIHNEMELAKMQKLLQAKIDVNLVDSENIVRVLKEHHNQELQDLKKLYDEKTEYLESQIKKLNSSLAVKDEEKQLALKKQALLIKELQKAVREERKRADSVEKLKERDWQVVESDVRSGHTFDGNESVSSLSALESDNVELINKLTSLQRVHAEVVHKLGVLEGENDALQKEVIEKGELIEHWIRSRPQPSSGACSQKPESALRKFLTTTLAGDEQVSDLRDMNRKLQRMLEETLSKNIILQRDIQTLIERTEM